MAPKKAQTGKTTSSATEEVADTKPDADKSQTASVRKVSSHPPTMEMVKEALKKLDSRKGVSAQAIRSFIKEKHPSVDALRLTSLVRRALIKGLEKGLFTRPANSAPTMTGAQGRFRFVTKGKANENKPKENADPNIQKALKATKPKKSKVKDAGKTKETDSEEEAQKPLSEPQTDGSVSKVLPAKKPKAKKPKPKSEKQSKDEAKKLSPSKGKAKKTSAPGKKKAKDAAESKDAADSKAVAVKKAPVKRGKK